MDDSIESFFHPHLNIHHKTLSAFITKDSDITHGKYLALLGNFSLLASLMSSYTSIFKNNRYILFGVPNSQNIGDDFFRSQFDSGS